ncbi:hypothetical protein DSO57_1012415 [Entomophthora muscae]|uniref:Uncharacterized protein n=2 Tax=Entomophthora muscae TaxID=34485 RepID=A0ACC2UQM2_9FUNG|nr:hypothetical protein DSO57_1016971 [Entomophthora muscae]KAJ9089497.1 hypothetical protein DSO57_1012415 [Entomophthora muscae]
MVGLIWFALLSDLLAYLPGGIKRVNYNKPVTVVRVKDEALSTSNVIQHVKAGNSFRNDKFLTSIYEPSGLLLPKALNTTGKCIHNECVSISNVSLHFHTSTQVSDPIACLILPCSISTIAINRTWEALNKSQFKRDDVKLIFSKFLKLALPKQLFSPSIVYEAKTPSVYILYFKPVSWIIKGKYVKKYHKKVLSCDFNVDLPLIRKDSYINGAFGMADLCTRDPASRPTTTSEYYKLKPINTFFCPPDTRWNA